VEKNHSFSFEVKRDYMQEWSQGNMEAFIQSKMRKSDYGKVAWPASCSSDMALIT
jgi:hypothetical protein